MAETKTQRVVFSNRGLVEKLDINQLDDSQYSLLLNMVSVQEGCIKPRYGFKKIATSWGGPFPSLIHTMGVVRSGYETNPTVYLGSGTEIKRVAFSGKYTAAATTIAGPVSSSAQKFNFTQYKTDRDSESSTVYMATGEQMLKDDGTYLPARRWGILPPAVPAITGPGVYDLANVNISGTINGSYSLANTRLTGGPYTVSTVTAVVGGSGAGYYTIGAASACITQLQAGMVVTVGSQDIIVDTLDGTNNTFNAYFPILPAPGDSIVAWETVSINSASPGSVTTITSSALTADLSLNGSPDNGYNGDDIVHFSFYVSDPTPISDIRLRLYVDGSTASYYEKSILADPAQGVVASAASTTDTARADTTLNEYSKYEDTNVYGQYDQTTYDAFSNSVVNDAAYNNTSSGLRPETLNATTGASWTELSIPKNQFLAVGVSGEGRNSWKYITSYEVVVKPVSTVATYTFKIGSLFAYGGRGPNSNQSGILNPYDYVYTYFDPSTGTESNPCATQIPSKGIRAVRQGILVSVYGYDNTGVNAGITKIKIYRRGGAFSDSYFRYVGSVNNPGAGASAIFPDTMDDLSIVSASVAEFDNLAPVTADLGYQEIASLASVTPTGGAGDPVIITTASNITITPGTVVTIGGGTTGFDNTERIVVLAVTGANSFTSFLQYTHNIGEQVTYGSLAGSAGDLTLYAFQRMWVAGVGLTPNVVYSSKTSRPESFPIINDATQNAHIVAVSSPDDPINGLAEFREVIVCLCQNSIYLLSVSNGVISSPTRSISNRGLIAKNAWGYVDNELWFLSYDGIYSFDGNQVMKRTTAIDPFFNGETVNGIPPMKKTGSAGGLQVLDMYCIAQKGNDVLFNCFNTANYPVVLRYNLLFDRWSMDELYDANSLQTIDRNGYTLGVCSTICLCPDRATGDLFMSRSVSTPAGTLADIDYFDDVTANRDGGDDPLWPKIYYEAKSKFFDLGAPLTRKTFTDLGVEVTVGEVDDDYNLQMYYDYSGIPNSLDTFALSPANPGRQIFELPLQQSGSPNTTEGKQARSFQFDLYGLNSALTTQWHDLVYAFFPMADIQKGRVTDWDDLGHPFDKRLYTCTIEYDNENTEVILFLDTITGVYGGTQNLGIQQIILPAASGRAKISVPIDADVIAKMVRLRPVVATTSTFQIYNYSFTKDDYPKDIVKTTDFSNYGYQYEKRLFQLYIDADTGGANVNVDIEGDGALLQTVVVNGTNARRMLPIPILPDKIATQIRLKLGTLAPGVKFQLFNHAFDFEQLPKPIVESTPWTDFGYDYLKYAEQISLDVNTNNQPVPVQIWCDGTLAQTITVTATQAERNKNITLNPGITFQTMRLIVDIGSIPSGGRFQLWDYRPIFRPADKGPVYHTFDWDNVGHPYDKKLKEVTIEFETQGLNVNVALDTLTGIDGNVQNLNVQTLTLNSQNRGYKTFPVNDIICKMVRIRSLGTNSNGTHNPAFKMWGYTFSGTVNYPADKVISTEPGDLKYPCNKLFRGMGIEIDTGSTDCIIQLVVDGSVRDSWTVNTTNPNRRVFLSPNVTPEIEGKLYSINLIPANGGKSQLFGDPDYKFVRDACEYNFWDSYEQAFGSRGYTVIKQVWADYKCAGNVIMKFFDEFGNLLWTEILPPHATRDVSRFFLPVRNGSVLNKSKKHRFTLQASSPSMPFYLYRDSSRIEYINLSADQSQGYYQSIFWENLTIPV